jgi:hypothetical protein
VAAIPGVTCVKGIIPKFFERKRARIRSIQVQTNRFETKLIQSSQRSYDIREHNSFVRHDIWSRSLA